MSITWGRSGRPWRRTRQIVLTRDGRICGICHHGIEDDQPGEVDHYPLSLEELRAARLDPNNPDYCRAAHGNSSPCFECMPSGWPCQVHGRTPNVTVSAEPSAGPVQSYYIEIDPRTI